MKLLIVESPAKTKTIKKYLGSDYTILPSVGHVRDLKPVDGSVHTEEDFEMDWAIINGKEKQIREIERALAKSDELLLATDPDREGEAISWHILDILKERNKLKDIPVKRVVFHEITKKAVNEAIANPRELDDEMVNAYLARRALDFLVGFNISPVLWRKLPGSKSAGRVQSVALRVLCEREDEIEKFDSKEYWSVEAEFKTKEDKKFKARLTHLNGEKLEKFSITNEDDAKKALEALDNQEYTIDTIERKQSQRKPVAPFTTSTLQQEASRKLRFGAKQTMRTAQRLYEGFDIGGETTGLITYMRTDAVNLAKEAVDSIREYALKEYGEKYLPKSPIDYTNKSKNAQEAHEAIRPTSILRTPDSIAKYLDADQLKLYELIWKRTIACQMANAVLDQVAVDIKDGSGQHNFRANGSIIAFDGFLKVYKEDEDDKEEKDSDSKMLPVMNEGDVTNKDVINPEQHFTQPPPRYSEASLVKRLEELGIGRPSTYATIITVIQDRQYVRIEKRRFVCEERGRIVSTFLKQYFAKYVEYDFTAYMENLLDEISNGNKNWKEVLREFWTNFIEAVNNTKEISAEEIAEKISDELAFHLFPESKDGSDPRVCPDCKEGKLNIKLGKFGGFIGCAAYPECKYTRPLAISADDKYIDEKNANTDGVKELGEDNKGQKITLRKGPYGFYIQLGEIEKGSKAKPKRASLPKGTEPDDIDLKKAKFLLSLPKKLAVDENDNAIELGIGRYGPYLKKQGSFKSIPEGTDLFSISKDQAIELASNMQAKATGEEIGMNPDNNKPILYFSKGRYGPYIKCDKDYVSIPKAIQEQIESGTPLALEDALQLIDAKKKKAKK